jgi:hypothetical protein
MMHLRWTGKAVSENKRHTLQYRRRKGSRGEAAKPMIGAADEYNGFKYGLAIMFQSQAHGRTYYRPDVRIQATLARGSQLDRNNLIKAICDALQIARIIKNDRELNYSHMHLEPVTEHDKGKDDEICVYLTGGESG